MKQVILFLTFTLRAAASWAQADYTGYVKPSLGTDGTGHTFPGACVPFGMVQPSPDNADVGWDYTSGYQYRDTSFLGFSNTHFSGTGIAEGGDVLTLPYIDTLPEGFRTGYVKASENATPGYYGVTLRQGVHVELTASEHVALHRYTFPATGLAKVYVDLQHGLRFLDNPLVLESEVKLEDAHTLVGYVRTQNWVARRYYFVLQFEHACTHVGQLPPRPGEKAPRYVFEFADLAGRILQAKVSLSSVSVEGARKNAGEVSGWDFGAVKRDAQRQWNAVLGRFRFKAPQTQKEILYTSLYHLCIQPNNLADVDGRYRGADGAVAVSTSPDKRYYSTFSIWDAYRSAFPFYTLLVPERVDGMVRSLLDHAKAAGFLPVYSIWGQENYCMIGNHAIPMITAAYTRGFRGFSGEEALQAMVRSTTEPHLNSDWAVYNRFGYYPFDKVTTESVSRTAESGYDDHAVALLADALGKADVAATYRKRAGYYRNLIDPETGLLRGKDSVGRWRDPFDPLKPTSPMNNPGDYTEANAWQYTWTPAQHDVVGLAKIMGGMGRFTGLLNQFFSLKTPNPNKHLGQEALIGQYAHGNEVSHHIAYLYAYTSDPKPGHKILNRIYQDFYQATPSGLIGNDDCGAMASWYLFTTLGFYPVDPASGKYVFGLPQAAETSLSLPGGKTFRIVRKEPGASRPYLDGKRLTKPELTHTQILAGGVLRFE